MCEHVPNAFSAIYSHTALLSSEAVPTHRICLYDLNEAQLCPTPWIQSSVLPDKRLMALLKTTFPLMLRPLSEGSVINEDSASNCRPAHTRGGYKNNSHLFIAGALVQRQCAGIQTAHAERAWYVPRIQVAYCVGTHCSIVFVAFIMLFLTKAIIQPYTSSDWVI